MLSKFETVRTTVTIPTELISRSQKLIDNGVVPSRNAFIITAIEYFLSELERQEIDRQFEAMAVDKRYQALSESVEADFADSDWEALIEGETG